MLLFGYSHINQAINSIIIIILMARGGHIRVNPNLPDQPDLNLHIRFGLKQVSGLSGEFYGLLWVYSVWFGWLTWIRRNPN